MATDTPAPSGALLSSAGQVLVCLARDPGVRLREVAASVGLTERAVQKLLGALERQGLVSRVRVGRRNRYRVHGTRVVTVPGGRPCEVGALLALLVPAATAA